MYTKKMDTLLLFPFSLLGSEDRLVFCIGLVGCFRKMNAGIIISTKTCYGT